VSGTDLGSSFTLSAVVNVDGDGYSNDCWKSTYAPINFVPPDAASMNNWPDHMGFRSQHPGGAQFCYADGHVSMLREAIDMNVYQALSTRGQGEIIQDNE
jgi:prepilin-type processing-associated H-X9-DG protein